MIIQGKIRKGKEIQGWSHITVDFSVDELMKYNTPHVNFWTFCLLNNLLKYNEEEEVYYPTIHLVDLTLSEDEEKNRIIKEMFKKLDVPVF